MLPRAWSAVRKILRFEQKIESAVMRMAKLGCIEEEEEETALREGELLDELLSLAEKDETNKKNLEEGLCSKTNNLLSKKQMNNTSHNDVAGETKPGESGEYEPSVALTRPVETRLVGSGVSSSNNDDKCANSEMTDKKSDPGMNVNLCDGQETCEQDLIVAQSSQETTKKKYEEMLPNVVMTKCVIVRKMMKKVD